MNEQVMNVLSKKWVVPAVVGVTSFSVGGVFGYILGKRNGDVFELSSDVLNPKVDDIPADPTLFTWMEDARKEVVFSNAVRAVEEAKLRYFNEEFTDEIPWDLEEEAELMIEEDELLEALDEQTHSDIITNDGETIPEIQNIFGSTADDWDYELELSSRDPNEPYVISEEEWNAEEAGCEQSTVTYYAGDNIMADPYDTPIYNHEQMMGDLKFGHGTNDKSVVYIRNESMEMEWEVLLHTGRFEIEVLGHDIESAYEARELKHSVPRFREE